MRESTKTFWTVVVFAASVVPVVGADTLYRWFDEQGRPHFADQPPPQARQPVERLPVPSYAQPEIPPDQAPYSIMNQLQRLEASRARLARERREQQQQRDREFQLRQRELDARERTETSQPGVPVYSYPRPFRRPTPPHGWRWPIEIPQSHSLWQPDHPAYRPQRLPHRAHPGTGVVLPPSRR